jgi:hypothetical protein
VRGQLPIRRIEIRFIPAGTTDGTLQVIGGQDLGGSLKELEGVDMGFDPGGKVLGQGGLRKGIIAGSQGGHEDVGRVDLSGLGIGDFHRLSSIIDEELFSGPIFLTQTEIQFVDPVLIVITEPAVLVAVRIGFLVFVPQKLEGYAFFLQLLIKVLHGGHGTLLLSDTGNRRIKPAFEGSFIKLRDKGPIGSLSLGPTHVIVNRASANA